MRAGKTPVKRGAWPPFLFPALVSVCLFFPALEGVLRLSGYGYHAGYLSPRIIGGKPFAVGNPDFFRTWFPVPLVPYADPFAIPEAKDPGAYRIFILGESAAAGIPDPAFGFSRMLERMLAARHPGIRFEVFNLAVTAINSHVILSIAKAAAKEKPDLFLVYMGNNEVIGPFGPGTVFVPFAGSNAFIRIVEGIKSTRTGQMLEGVLGLAGFPGAAGTTGTDRGGAPKKWAGMEMFLSRAVAWDDPRMENVYGNFQDNLEGIYSAAHGSGAGIVFASVSTNLRDTRPFASGQGKNLGAKDSQAWQALCDSGAALAATLEPERMDSAMHQYARAMRLDGMSADLAYRGAKLLLDRGHPDSAAQGFALAERLDQLRFRADPDINLSIDNLVRRHRGEAIWLADVDSAFKAAATDHIPGNEFFYEHAHLRPKGNYLLAKTFVPFVDSALTASGRFSGEMKNAPQPLPALDAIRASLALTGWNELGMAEKILALVQRPPFINAGDPAVGGLPIPGGDSGAASQAGAEDRLGPAGAFARANRRDREDRIRLMQREVDSLKRYATNDSLQVALEQYQAALQAHPDDPILHRNLGEMFYACDYLPTAAEQYRLSLETLPHDTRARQHLAKALAEQGDLPGAIAEYRAALESAPGSAEIQNGLANALAGVGKHAEAVRHYLRALEGETPLPEVHFNLARTYIALGRIPEAVAQLEAALKLEPGFQPALRELERIKASGVQ